VTPDQFKTARTLLGWELKRSAARSGVSLNVVKVLEQDGRAMTSFIRTDQVNAVAAMRATFKAAGVDFTNGDAPCVRLRPKQD